MGVNWKKIEGSGTQGDACLCHTGRARPAIYGLSKSKKGIPSPFVGETRHSRIGNGWPNKWEIKLEHMTVTTEVLVRGPPSANFLSTSGFLLHPQSRQREPPQAPPHEVVELQQPDITTDGERDLRVGSAS